MREVATAALASIALLSSSLGLGAEPERKTDVTVVPYGGGDGDIGIGGGLILSVARLTGDHEPYLWRLETVSLATFRSHGLESDKKLELPYIDAYVLLSLPHAVMERLRLELRVSYTREQRLRYYGIGNAAELPEGADLHDDRFVYSREHPTFRLHGESRVVAGVTLIHGFAYTHNWLGVAPDSLLADDRENGKRAYGACSAPNRTTASPSSPTGSPGKDATIPCHPSTACITRAASISRRADPEFPEALGAPERRPALLRSARPAPRDARDSRRRRRVARRSAVLRAPALRPSSMEATSDCASGSAAECACTAGNRSSCAPTPPGRRTRARFGAYLGAGEIF